MNPFKVLNLPYNCSDKDVKDVYYKLAQKFHPDRSKDSQSTERFKLISNAYEILKDEKLRRKFIEDHNYGDFHANGTYNGGGDHHQSYNSSRNNFHNKSYSKNINRTMDIFESLLSPRFLLIILPIGIFSYWSIKGLFPGFLQSDNSNLNQLKSITFKKEIEKVDAWYNPRTRRWESPAPWDENYKLLIKEKLLQLQKIDKKVVFTSIPPAAPLITLSTK